MRAGRTSASRGIKAYGSWAGGGGVGSVHNALLGEAGAVHPQRSLLSVLRLQRTDCLLEMTDDSASGSTIVFRRRRYVRPIGDFSSALQIGRYLIKGENLGGSGHLFRREPNRDFAVRSQSVARQALANNGGDLVIHGDATRNPDNGQPPLPGEAIEISRRNLPLAGAVEDDKHDH